MEIAINLFLFLTGLAIGSFINAQVYRLAIKFRFIKDFQFLKSNFQNKRSFCDGCGRQLRWYENVPVISWLIQGGKSRCCKKKLSVLYPIVEFLIGILFLIFYRKFGQVVNMSLLLLGMFIIGFLVFGAVFDLKYMILPDFSTIVLVILAIVYNVLDYEGTMDWWIPHLLSAGASFLFFWSLYMFTKGKGMGFGDVKLVFFIGLFLGWPGSLIAFYVAFIVGALVAVVLMLLAGFGRKSQIPFGPFLILGTTVAWFWGDGLWIKWLRLFY